MRENQAVDRDTLVPGIILILIGGLFLLDRFTGIEFGDVVRTFWPVAIIVTGVSKLFQPATFWNGLWLMAVGGWMQMIKLDLFGLTWRNSWPLLLILLGAGMIARSFVDDSIGQEGNRGC